MKKKIFSLILVVLMLMQCLIAMSFTAGAADGDTYKLVTSNAELEAGGKYLIVCSSKSMVMGAQSGKYRTGVGAEITDNTITGTPEGAAVVTLGGNTDAWTLSVSDGYLAYPGSGNYVTTKSDVDTWKISVTDEGIATIENVSAAGRKLQWNAGSPRFACYTSAQTAISIFKFVPPPHEHAYSWDGNIGVDGVHNIICANTDGKCDATSIAEECAWDDGFCTVCGAEAPECAHPTTEEVAETPATCTKIGYTAGVQCTVCNQYTEGHEEIPATGHTIVEIDEAVAPTCTEKGLTASSCCENCDECDVEQTEVDALGHNYVDGFCTRCDKKKTAFLTINRDSFSDGDGYAWIDWSGKTTEGDRVVGSGFIYGTASTYIQMNGGKTGDYIYNSTAIPGKIVSVTIKRYSNGSERNMDVLTSETPFSSATTDSLKDQATTAAKKVTTDGVTWEFNTNHKYFAIVLAEKSAIYLSSIEIEYEPAEDKLEGYTVTLGDNIGVNFYMSLGEETLADESAYMLFTLPNGTTEKVYVKDVKNSPVQNGEKTCYRFTGNIAVKEMAESIKAQLVTAAGSSEEYTYSVKQYAMSIIGDSAKYTANEIALAKALLNYGANAQLMFGYNTDNLANSELAEEDKAIGDVTVSDTYKKDVSANVTGAKYLGTSTMWEADTAIRHYFDITGEGITFKLYDADGQLIKDLEILENENGKYITVDGIVAKDMARTYKIVVSNGTEEQTINYSVYSYFYDILASSSFSETEKAAIKAAYIYAEASINYLA